MTLDGHEDSQKTTRKNKYAEDGYTSKCDALGGEKNDVMYIYQLDDVGVFENSPDNNSVRKTGNYFEQISLTSKEFKRLEDSFVKLERYTYELKRITECATQLRKEGS